MDTDDLSRKTYKAILVEAEKFDHNLTLQFGVLAEECKNENEYIKEAVQLVRELQEMDEDELEYDVFFGEPFNKKELYYTLTKILENISKLNADRQK